MKGRAGIPHEDAEEVVLMRAKEADKDNSMGTAKIEYRAVGGPYPSRLMNFFGRTCTVST